MLLHSGDVAKSLRGRDSSETGKAIVAVTVRDHIPIDVKQWPAGTDEWGNESMAVESVKSVIATGFLRKHVGKATIR
jgi:hypothetical protein